MGKIIGFIPVRAGSKSIPGKNIKSFNGKPLLYWTVRALHESGKVDKIVIATDGEEIKKTALAFPFPNVWVYDRSAENASDVASTESVLLEFIEAGAVSDDDIIVLVQATSPLLTGKDVSSGVGLYQGHNGEVSVLSAVRTKRFFWDMSGNAINYNYKNRPRRQDFDGTFMENGAFYINSVGAIKKYSCRLSGKVLVSEMPEYTALELDEPEDWTAAEALMRKHQSPAIQPELQKIKLFISDVDGVLTDGSMYYSESGDELKKFNTRDGMGFELLHNNNIVTAIITSEETTVVSRRAKKLKVKHLVQGAKFGGKLKAAQAICDCEGVLLSEVAYIGDDLNCVDLLSAVGFPACPSDARPEVKAIPGIRVLAQKGGHGVVRDYIDQILFQDSMPTNLRSDK